MGIWDGLGLRRPKHRAGQMISAAATVIDPDDEKERKRIAKGATDWQRRAWEFYDNLEAISYPAEYVAGALGRLRLGPAMRPDTREQPVMLDPDGDDDLELSDEERAALHATWDRISQGPIDIGEIQKMLALNLFIAGDGYLLGYKDDDSKEELWDVCSVEELVKAQDGKGYARKRTLEAGYLGAEALPDDAFICRIYQRHPRFSEWARSSMKPVNDLCDELKVLTDAIMASGQSRIPAGIAFLTHGLVGLPVDETATGQEDEAADNPLAQQLIRHFSEPVKNRRNASSVVPLLVIGEPEDIKESHIWEPSREIDKVAAEQRTEIIQRIAIGLDIPAEILTGKADLNHWTMWQVSEDTFKFHLEPDAQIMVNALTTGYFRMHLAKMGIDDVNRFFVWYDATDLISHPNRAEDYEQAYDRIEASGDAYRRAKNIPDDDKPEDDERALRIWEKIIEKLRLAPGMEPPSPADVLAWINAEHKEPPKGPDGQPIVVQPVQPAVGPGGQPLAPSPTAPPAGPANVKKGPPQTKPPSQQAAVELPSMAQLSTAGTLGPIGPRLHDIESRLRLRLLQASSDRMRHVLERAGSRLRSLAQKNAAYRNMLVNVPSIEIGKYLGQQGIAQLQTTAEDLLDGEFDTLIPDYERWTTRAQEQALALVDEHGELTEADVAMIRNENRMGLDNGKAVLVAGLLGLGAALIYEPHREPPERGEWSDFLVDPGIIRDVLIAAGGGADSDLTSGLFSGATMHSLYDSAGLTVRSMMWQHGDPERPFEPHEELDGEIFYTEDDERLDSGGDFTAGDHYHPGDHKGCLCSILESVEVEPASDSEE